MFELLNSHQIEAFLQDLVVAICQETIALRELESKVFRSNYICPKTIAGIAYLEGIAPYWELRIDTVGTGMQTRDTGTVKTDFRSRTISCRDLYCIFSYLKPASIISNVLCLTYRLTGKARECTCSLIVVGN